MKIIYISSSVIPSTTANSIHVMKMCNALSSCGHEVALLALGKEGDVAGVEDIFNYYGVKQSFLVRRIPFFPIKGRSYLYGVMAGSWAITSRANLVFGRQLVGCFWAALLGAPVVYESHAPVIELGRISEYLFRLMVRKPNFLKFVVITEALRDYYVARYPVLEGKIVVAPDGADPVNIDSKIRAAKFNRNRLNIGYVGQLYKGRGVELIMALAKRCQWGDFHIVGGAAADVNRFRAAISGFSNVFFHGHVSPAEAESYRLGCDVLLAPYQESVSVHGNSGDTSKWMSPLKIFEYMAAGKAIVCSDLPVLREILTDGVSAILCNPTDVDEWCDAINSLKSDYDLRISLGMNALSDFEHYFSWKARASNLLKEVL